MNLEQRLERLERENRWTRGAALAGAALLAALVLVGQGRANEPPEVIRAGRFELVRSDGSVEGRWTCGDDFGTQLVMGVAGSGCVQLGTDKAGVPYVSLYDQEDRLRACLSQARNPRLVLYDSAEKSRMDLSVIPDGMPAITLQSADGGIRAMLAGHAEETVLVLRDASKATRLKLFARSTGESGIRIDDGSGTTVWEAPAK